MTIFVMFCMLAIGFLSGIIATVGFVAYLETKPIEEMPPPKSDGYMSLIDTPESNRYHAMK